MLKKLFRPVPLLGPLVDCHLIDHWNATQEISLRIIFSTVPIWLGSVLIRVMAQPAEPVSFTSALALSVGNGEMLLYCASVIAPILWMALKDPPGERAFPSRLSHIGLLIVFNVLAAGVFGVQKSGRKINPDTALHISLWMFGLSVILVYLATVYHNSIVPDSPGQFQRNEANYVDRFERRPK